MEEGDREATVWSLGVSTAEGGRTFASCLTSPNETKLSLKCTSSPFVLPLTTRVTGNPMLHRTCRDTPKPPPAAAAAARCPSPVSLHSPAAAAAAVRRKFRERHYLEDRAELVVWIICQHPQGKSHGLVRRNVFVAVGSQCDWGRVPLFWIGPNNLSSPKETETQEIATPPRPNAALPTNFLSPACSLSLI